MTQAAVAQAPVPSHIPPHLVRDFDLFERNITGPVHEWWDQLHDGPDIFWTPRNGGHWVVTRYADLAHLMADPQEFSSRHTIIPKASHAIPAIPFESDAPLHTEYRRLIAPFLAPKAIGQLEARARALIVRLLDEIQPRGHCEFINEVSLVLPIVLFMSLMDLPETDRPYLLSLGMDTVRGSTLGIQKSAYAKLYAYIEAKLAERRRKPGNDILSAMLAGRVGEDGRPLNRDELVGMGVMVLGGGLDTVASMMGFIMWHLADNPEHRRRLIADPKGIPAANEEMMRRYGISNVARVVARDVELSGVAMSAGDMVLVATCLGGLDDRQFDQPLKVDFDRPERKSIVFGKGPHQCVGAWLARAELRTVVETWLARIPDFRVSDGADVISLPGKANCVVKLPLVWDV